MTITKQLGGDRLGSGNKMAVSMHNYERSTHDLSRVWRSSMAAGTLVPFMTEITLPGDTFDIDLNTMIRTLPTLAPLFGSFKVQLDVFSIPIRLYNAQLHMNKLGVGMKMSDVKFPMAKIACKGSLYPVPDTFDQSSLLAYLGIRGAPRVLNGGFPNDNTSFKKNALFLLAYWDIYKNYYANKQEEIGFLVSSGAFVDYALTALTVSNGNTTIPLNLNVNTGKFNEYTGVVEVFTFTSSGKVDIGNLYFSIVQSGGREEKIRVIDWFTVVKQASGFQLWPIETWPFETSTKWISIEPVKMESGSSEDLRLKPFRLANIDDTILKILSQTTSVPFEFNEIDGIPPFLDCVGTVYPEVYLPNYQSQAGLGIKTYQSDIFQNWLNTEWIDGVNGINTITAISTQGDSFTLDTLNLSKKVYDMLNRVAVSGGSYEDWQEAIYGEQTFRRAESPIYCGGLSTELVFEEVVSTADSTTTDGEIPLGSLAGKGTQSNKRKGGNIVIKTTEPSMIMGIVSITPRIDYSQGNKWHTHLKTMDDLHKPALDGIGFQELITENMCHWDSEYDVSTEVYKTKSAGKQPAWINYMTSYNETYGHFAEKDNLMHLTLNRQYEYDDTNLSIKDLTTYIDPIKYNYAFAQTDLSAQNFWVQIAADVTARRKMSAKIIPNL